MNTKPILVPILLIISASSSSGPAQAYEGTLRFHFTSNIRTTRPAVPTQGPGNKYLKAKSATAKAYPAAGQWLKGRLLTRNHTVVVTPVPTCPTDQICHKYARGALLLKDSKDRLSLPTKVSGK